MTTQSNDAADPKQEDQRSRPRGGGGDDRSKALGPDETFGRPEEGAAGTRETPATKEQPRARGGGGDDRSKALGLGPDETFGGPDEGAGSEGEVPPKREP